MDTQSIDERFPGIQGVGFIERVKHDDLQSHVEMVQAEGYHDYSVRPKGDRPEYYPVSMIEPLDARNQRAFGFDVHSEEIKSAALDAARDSGTTKITGKITLIQENDQDVQSGFLMMMPVYKNGEPTTTLEERQAALQGFVYSPFRMNDLMHGILGATFQDVSFQVYDGPQKPDKLMYDRAAAEGYTAGDLDLSMTKASTLEFGGRQWTVSFTALKSSADAAEAAGPYVVLAAGFALSGLLFYILHSSGRVRDDLEELARVTDQIASGNMNVEIRPGLLDSKGTIWSLAMHFESMKENVKKHTQELERANDELRRLDTLKDEFINVAAHELRNPITPILIMIENLQEEFGDREEVRIIARNARKIHELVKSILNVARLENQSIVLEKEKFDLSLVLTDAAQDAKKQVEDSGKKVTIVYEPKPIEVTADRWKMAEVVLNLVDNAIKFTGEGVVAISAEADGRQVTVSVKDSGSGIHPDIMPRLFTKFATKSEKGTGIGLYFSRKIVAAHGGRIWAENNKDRGATFSFSIPLGAPETQITTDSAKAIDAKR